MHRDARTRQEGDAEREGESASSQASGEEAAADCILLGACGPSEVLPQNPELPADIFTACLTTPVRVRLQSRCSVLFTAPSACSRARACHAGAPHQGLDHMLLTGSGQCEKVSL